MYKNESKINDFNFIIVQTYKARLKITQLGKVRIIKVNDLKLTHVELF